MKGWSLKRLIQFGVGLISGFIIYDFLFKDNINWIKAIISGIIAVGLIWIYQQIVQKSNSSKTDQNNEKL